MRRGRSAWRSTVLHCCVSIQVLGRLELASQGLRSSILFRPADAGRVRPLSSKSEWFIQMGSELKTHSDVFLTSRVFVMCRTAPRLSRTSPSAAYFSCSHRHSTCTAPSAAKVCDSAMRRPLATHPQCKNVRKLHFLILSFNNTTQTYFQFFLFLLPPVILSFKTDTEKYYRANAITSTCQ